MKNKNFPQKSFFYITFLLVPFMLLQCKSYELQVAKSENNDETFVSTLIIDSCLVKHQYEGKSSEELLRVQIAGNNKKIPQWAFAIVPSLKEVKLSSIVRSIEDNAFYSCKQLSRINLNNVDTIGENSFKYSALEEVNLSKVIIIKDFAFANCTTLRDVIFSDKLETIGDFAFSGDTALVFCHVPTGNIGACAFMGCSNLERLSFGKVESIGRAAFLGCNTLKSVVIPSSVKKINSEAFRECMNLKEIIVNSYDTKIAEDAFEEHVVITYKIE